MTGAIYTEAGPLVSTEWLADHLDDRDLVPVDGSWYLAAMGRDPLAEYLAGHVPGALFWDLDSLSDQANPLPHMLPAASARARDLGRLGIGNDDLVVVMDGSGANLSAARVWWELRVFGHERVRVLDGGLLKWKAEGRPLDRGRVTRPPTSYTARFHPEMVRSFDQVLERLGATDVGLLDARSRGRFEGREPEPRPGLRSGHIPGAKNLPYGELVAADGTMLPPSELEARFRDAGLDLTKPVVLACGSGVSACALALGLERIGRRDYAVYDGSWTEWGGRAGAPIETGPA